MYFSDEKEIEAVSEVIRSKKLFRNQGPDNLSKCQQFEKKFSTYLETQHALLVTSGTNALICALQILELKPNDEVIIPAFTFFSTAAAVIKANATPIVANIDETLSLCPMETEKLINKNTKAIIAVHMDGHAANMQRLKELAAKYNLYLIEDTAQAVGGKFQHKKLGSIGDIGCFSFNVDKIITCGEGGAIVTARSDFFEKALCIQDMNCPFGATYKNFFKEIKPFIGESMRVSEIQGAMINEQLNKLDSILQRLKRNNTVIQSILCEHGISTSPLNCVDGDCNTSFNLLFNSAEEAKIKMQKLLQHEIIAIPIFARPAHAVWQWQHLISEVRDAKLYHKANFLPSIDILSRTLKIEVPYELEVSDCSVFAQKIVSTLLAD